MIVIGAVSLGRQLWTLQQVQNFIRSAASNPRASCRRLAGRDQHGQATTSIALPLTRVSPFRLSTVTYVSYQVRRGRTPKRLVNSATRSSVNQACAVSRLSQR